LILIRKELVLLLVPLILAAFTHLWNVAGFPLFHTDEGHYMRRALIVLNGIGILDKARFYDDAYGSPFFGQILLGSLLKLSGYPNFAMAQTISSIELAMAFPRMIMGIIAVVDTFLVFKICQRAYNIQIALFASILFAVTPMTWLTRMITLDSIALPFLLTSVLISLNIETWSKNREGNVSRYILVFLSGTCLGLAILSKIPLFTMIPLGVYLIYKNYKNVRGGLTIKMITIWLIPILFIPSLWPLYAAYIGEFDLWQKGVLDQVTRQRMEIIETFFNIDLILLILGLAGLIYSLLRKDWIIVLWIVPFLIFVYAHGWFMYFHWVIVFPAFCIAAAKIVIDMVQRVKTDKVKKSVALLIICTTISSIGFFNTLTLLNQNLEAGAIKAIAEGLDYSDRSDDVNDDKISENITVIAPPEYSWIYKHIHKMVYAFDTHKDVGSKKIETDKTLILEKDPTVWILYNLKNKFSSFVLDIGKVRKICNLDIEWYKTNFGIHFPLVVIPTEHTVSSKNIIFSVNGSSKASNPERIDMKNVTARFINLTLLSNTENRTGAISKIMIYGKIDENDDCKKIPIKIIKFADRSLYFKTLKNYDIISSYHKLLSQDMKVSTYKIETHDLNAFTKLFAGFKFTYPPDYVSIATNY